MTEKIGDFTRAYWPVIVGMIAVAVAWGTSSAQIAAIGDGQRVISAKIDQMSEKVTAAQVTNLYTTEQIADLRARVHAIEARR